MADEDILSDYDKRGLIFGCLSIFFKVYPKNMQN